MNAILSVETDGSQTRLDAEEINQQLTSASVQTPAFVYDEDQLCNSARFASEVTRRAGAKLLYTLKPFAIADALSLFGPHLDGYAASSVFEARLARDLVSDPSQVHVNLPAASESDVSILDSLCGYLTFNSLSQWRRLRSLAPNASCGIRINPQLSFIDDPRYDPCRPDSKLGTPLSDLSTTLNSEADVLASIQGLHFHSNCDSTDFEQLLATGRHIVSALGDDVLEQVQWINMGGGYLFLSEQDTAPLREAVDVMQRHGAEVFLEPGASLVREAGYLVTTVLDLFSNGAANIAILDTSVNHLPEVFEYQFSPDLLRAEKQPSHRYTLAGCSCLSGDVFGSYDFDEPLAIGQRLVFTDVGAYSLVKAHFFNGINLPTIYALRGSGEVILKKAFTYQDFLTRCGVPST